MVSLQKIAALAVLAACTLAASAHAMFVATDGYVFPREWYFSCELSMENSGMPRLGALSIDGVVLTACSYHGHCVYGEQFNSEFTPDDRGHFLRPQYPPDDNISTRARCLTSSPNSCPTFDDCEMARYANTAVEDALRLADDGQFTMTVMSSPTVSAYPEGDHQ